MRTTCYSLAAFCLVATLSGCFYSREMVKMQRDIERLYPTAEFDREVMVSLGPVSMRTMGWIAGLVPEPEAQRASDYLHDIRRVKVAVYNTDYLPDLDDFDPTRLPRFEREGWEVAVKAREDDELVWVLYRERRETVRDLYVVVLDDEDLVMARLQGHLSHLLERAMADHAEFMDWGAMPWRSP